MLLTFSYLNLVLKVKSYFTTQHHSARATNVLNVLRLSEVNRSEVIQFVKQNIKLSM